MVSHCGFDVHFLMINKVEYLFSCMLANYVSSLRVLCFMFRSLIHFEFIVMYGIRLGSNFTLLRVNIPFSQHHWLKTLSFSFCTSLLLLSTISGPYI